MSFMIYTNNFLFCYNCKNFYQLELNKNAYIIKQISDIQNQIQSMQVTLPNFILLHNHLASILSTNNFENQELPQKVMQYIGMIVESEKNIKDAQDFFDFFCENNGNKILKLTLEADPFLAIKVLSLLFINLKNQNWISFLLCQPFVIDSIECSDVPEQEQWAEYYISLLKSLSIRLNNQHLSLFYNKKFPKFPLLYQSLKYYNHPDCMVRTNVMNIILGIMKIKDARLSKYFSRFPFLSYILTYCCQIKQRIDKFNIHLLEWDYTKSNPESKIIPAQHKSIVKMYFVDLLDYICYLNDLMELGSQELAFFIRNTIYVYLLLPSLAILQTDTNLILKKSALYLIYTLLKTINDETFKETICLLLVGRQLPKYFLDRILNIEAEFYTPKVYSDNFSLSNYYWNRFEYQIETYALKIFQDINNFETDHENKKQDESLKKQFYEEIGSISDFLGFDFLNYQSIEGKAPYTELRSYLGFQKASNYSKLAQSQTVLSKNVIREQFFMMFEKSCAELDDDICLSVSVLLNYCIKCDTISNNVLQFCGILMPRLDTKNYIEQNNLNNLFRIKSAVFSFLVSLIKASHNSQTPQPTLHCSLATLRNFVIILDNLIFKRLKNSGEEEQKILLNFYDQSINQIRAFLNVKNIKDMVQNFEFDYSKWGKEAMMPDNNLPYTIFHSKISDLPEQLDIHFLKQTSSQKSKVSYFIRYFAIFQSFYFKYIQNFIVKEGQQSPVTIEKYQTRYLQKFGKVEERWKLGQNYEIQFRHLVQCKSIQRNNKMKKVILVEDNHNLVIVEPSNQENTAKIIANHPWKYVSIEVDRTNGKKMTVKISKCIRSESLFNLLFGDQIRNASTLQWMNHLKYQRYQLEQALILGYIKDCLIRNE